jgi:hypothetical protein
LCRKVEHARQAGVHDVHAVGDGRRLGHQQADALVPGLVLGQIRDLALSVELPGALINPVLIGGNHGSDVGVG